MQAPDRCCSRLVQSEYVPLEEGCVGRNLALAQM